MMANLLKLSLGIVVLLVAMPAANSTQMFSDTWDDGTLYSPTYSSSGADWSVESGSFSVNSKRLSVSGSSRISIKYGMTAANSPVEAHLKLYNVWNSGAFYRFIFGFKNTDTGYYLREDASPNSTMNDGVSGFSSMVTTGFGPDDWTITAGVSGTSLSSAAGEWNYLKMKFDPSVGVEVWQAKSASANLKYDDPSLAYTQVASWRVFLNISNVNQFYIESGPDEPWLIDDVEVIGTPQPVNPVDHWVNKPTAIRTFYKAGVPHTDKNGVPLSTFSSDKSFLPLGAHHMWTGTAYRQTWTYSGIAKGGFNCGFMWCAQRPTPDLGDAAASAGVQLIVPQPSDSEILAMKDHPAILGWFMIDEPTGNYWGTDMNAHYQEYLARKAQIKALDPKHPVFINDVNWIIPPAIDWWKIWNTSGDVSAHDNYPISGVCKTLGFVSGITESVSLATTINNENKPVWFTAQAHYFNDATFGLIQPTTAQERCMVYTALIHGATGIFYFGIDSYTMRSSNCVGIAPSPLGGYGGTMIATPDQLAQAKALWYAVAGINSELTALRPAILSPTASEPYEVYLDSSMPAVTSNPIRTLLKKNPDGGYTLLLVNIDNVPQHVKVRFPNRNYTITERYGSLGITKNNDSVEMSCPAFDVRVLRILPATVTQLKTISDNVTNTSAYGAVSAVYSDCFYMQSLDRTSGLRVYAPTSSVTVGQIVNVTGTLSTTAAKERCIIATLVN